jgi:hypothetical protein
MDVSGAGKHDKKDGTHATGQQADEAAARTHVNLVSPFAHPRGGKSGTKRGAKSGHFDLQDFVTRHRVPLALSCLALVGGTIAAIVVQRRRRDTWDGRFGRLRQAFVDAANDAG